jgi:hypothetical protein
MINWLLLAIFPTLSNAELCLYDVCLFPRKRTWYEFTLSTAWWMFTSTMNAWYEFVIFRTMLFLTVLSSCVALIFVIWLIKRRPSTLTQTQEDQRKNSSNLYITNSMQYQSRPCTSNSNHSGVITRPHEFSNSTDPMVWFMKFEAFAKMYSTLDWLDLLVSLVSENCLKKISNLEQIKTKHDGYYLLKNALISTFGDKKIVSETPPKLQDLTNRIQNSNESLRTAQNCVIWQKNSYLVFLKMKLRKF